jgi:hypothetical protein
MKFMSEKNLCKQIVSSHSYANTLLVEDPGILLARIQATLADIVKVAWRNFIALMCRLEGIDVFMPLLKFLLA